MGRSSHLSYSYVNKPNRDHNFLTDLGLHPNKPQKCYSITTLQLKEQIIHYLWKKFCLFLGHPVLLQIQQNEQFVKHDVW